MFGNEPHLIRQELAPVEHSVIEDPSVLNDDLAEAQQPFVIRPALLVRPPAVDSGENLVHGVARCDDAAEGRPSELSGLLMGISTRIEVRDEPRQPASKDH